MSSFSVKTFHKGQLVFKKGQPGNKAFLIKKGAIDLCIIKDGRKTLLESLKTGQLFGELGLINEDPRPFDAIATEFTELVIIEKEFLNQFIKNSPGIVQAFLNAMISQFNRLSKQQDDDIETLTGANFLGISKVLNLMYVAHKNAQQTNQKGKKEGEDPGIDYQELTKKIRSVFPVNQLDIDNALKRLADLYYIEINFKKGQTAKTMQKFVKVRDPDNFDRVVENIAQHMGTDASYSAQEYIDIVEAAKMVNTTEELIYKKIASNEIPENLFFVNKSGFMEFASEKGEYFFKKAKRKRVKIEDIEDVNDLIYVDGKTLRDVLSEIGYYKLSVLMKIAEEETQQKLFSCLSGRIATIVKTEMEGLEDIDEIEAADIEEEIIEMVRQKKGV